MTEWAREIGYESISHDLVFGLPFQSLEDVLNTIDQTNSYYQTVWPYIAMHMYLGLKGMASAVLKMLMYPKMRSSVNVMKRVRKAPGAWLP